MPHFRISQHYYGKRYKLRKMIDFEGGAFSNH